MLNWLLRKARVSYQMQQHWSWHINTIWLSMVAYPWAVWRHVGSWNSPCSCELDHTSTFHQYNTSRLVYAQGENDPSKYDTVTVKCELWRHPHYDGHLLSHRPHPSPFILPTYWLAGWLPCPWGIITTYTVLSQSRCIKTWSEVSSSKAPLIDSSFRTPWGRCEQDPYGAWHFDGLICHETVPKVTYSMIYPHSGYCDVNT